MDCCQKTASIINFTTDDMTSKFELFSNNKMNNQYLTEIMRTNWLQILDEYWDEKYTPYSYDSDFWPDFLYKYLNELPLYESI